MKKTYTLVLLAFTVTACLEPSSSDLLSSSTGLPNGIQPIIPYAGCEEQTLDQDWVCTWADEFNGTSLNQEHWNIEVNGDGGGNQESQFYRAENVSVEDGNLVITAKRETFQNRFYTSGRINSRYKVNFRFGRVKFRAKLPGGRGTWAALWMLPLFNRYGQWPNSGEIDILEYVGYEPGKVNTATHTKKFNHSNPVPFKNPLYTRSIPGVETEFHEYEMIWLPGEIRIFADGVQSGIFRYAPQFNQNNPHQDVFPFHEDFFFIINLAIGGSWGGAQDIDNNIFPTQLLVDYLRVYQWDYARVDQQAPNEIAGLVTSQLKNTIHWNRGTDDTAVSKYALYLDGQFYREANIHQFTFVGLEVNRTYEVAVQAIDFVGRTSPISKPINFTFGG